MTDSLESGQSRSTPDSARLHYLDWLRVLAILMVFLFHAVHPFADIDWQINNPEKSEIVTIILLVMGLWGMPFFFLVAGAASWFALQRRTPRQYISERFVRLLIPFVVGTIIFSPLQFYLEWKNKAQLGVLPITFPAYIADEIPRFSPQTLCYPGFSPRWINFGFHLWFLAFLFFFALFTLPLFRFLNESETGKRVNISLARLGDLRGGTLFFILPLVLVQLLIRSLCPEEHDWGDFTFRMSFFILGYLLYSDGRLRQAVWRDWWLHFGVSTAALLVLLIMYLSNLPVVTWALTPSLPGFYPVQSLIAVVALGYTLAMVFVGMRFLDFTNRWLRYSQEAVLPFFVLHQPAIVAIAFYVVGWQAGVWIKLPTVVLGSFAISIGLYQLIIRPIRPFRLAFGMKGRAPEKQPAGTD
jgi:glucan biosynthesis protein C